jgi:hypothetical protein
MPCKERLLEYQLVLQRALILMAVVLSAIAASSAQADEPVEPAPPPAEPSAEVVPAVIPEGVTISGAAVGGMTAEQATAAVQVAFDLPLEFAFGNRTWQALPSDLGARPYIVGAVRRALSAAPGEAVTMVVTVRGDAVRAYVAHLDDVFSQPAKDATLRLKKLRPFLSQPRAGLRVLRPAMTEAIVRALRANQHGPLPLEAEVVEPKATLETFGPVIVIRRESKKLLLYRGQRYWKRFGVATGQSSYPTPLGRFSIVVKARSPWWYPPDSDWADGLKPVPPGPGNPLGTRWMGLSVRLVGIHGTPDAASIGYSASHGCIRMRIPDAEWLFQRVPVGTPVFIVRA